jgi:APA family basic amino acid/polyamine antiporter
MSSPPSPAVDPAPAVPPATPAQPELRRSLGPFTLMFYGVGSMLGAGIYALIGDASAQLGNAVWLAFVIAMVAALLTGLSYACLGSRYPRAAGAAYATHRAYRLNLLTYVVGLAVVASGLTSMATGARAIGREFAKADLALPASAVGERLAAMTPEFIGIVYLVLLSLVVYRGIRESMAMNVVCTIVEAAGLLLVIAVGLRYWGGVDYLRGPPTPDGTGHVPIAFSMLMSGAVLTFFSFIGFEDMLNVAEETRNPRRDIPVGVIGAMLIATTIYLAVAITAVSVGLPHDRLVKGGLRAVMGEAAPWFPPNLFGVITVFAVANTALLNYVMGSRLIYGLARQGLLPAVLGKVHARRQTPHVATFVLLGVIIVLMLVGGLDQLAASTVLLLLSVFTIVNVGLVILKFRAGEPRGGFEVPFVVPLLGAIVCASLAGYRVVHPPNNSHAATLIAGGLLVGIAVMYAILRPKAALAD